MNERGEHQTQPPLDVVVNDVRQFADRPEVKASERLNTPTQRVLEIITGKKTRFCYSRKCRRTYSNTGSGSRNYYNGRSKR